MRRASAIGLPGLSEPQVVRHYTRLSQKNYGIDSVFYPLGSCTMKHNPRLNEKMVRLAGFADLHPLQPLSTVQGALELIDQLEPIKRGIYGGACGYLSYAGDMDVAIAIRTGIIRNQTLYVQAAAGVVADSVPELEWKETEAKARALLRASELVEEGLE